MKRDKIIETLSEIEPDYIVAQVFDFYFEHYNQIHQLKSSEPHTNIDDKKEGGYDANKEEVCKFFGEYLLKTGPTFQLDEFMSMWQKAVPGGEDLEIGLTCPAFKTDITQLKGMALVDLEKGEIKKFPEWKLPTGIQERLKLLFNERPKWTLEDIFPYIESLTTPKLNVNALLTKYAKATNGPGGIKTFCAKYGK